MWKIVQEYRIVCERNHWTPIQEVIMNRPNTWIIFHFIVSNEIRILFILCILIIQSSSSASNRSRTKSLNANVKPIEFFSSFFHWIVRKRLIMMSLKIHLRILNRSWTKSLNDNSCTIFTIFSLLNHLRTLHLPSFEHWKLALVY